jgi:hypothetical protein
MSSKHETEDLMYCIVQSFNTSKSCHSKVLATICQFKKTTTTCAMISFSQFFHGLYNGILRNLLRRRFHTQYTPTADR